MHKSETVHFINSTDFLISMIQTEIGFFQAEKSNQIFILNWSSAFDFVAYVEYVCRVYINNFS